MILVNIVTTLFPGILFRLFVPCILLNLLFRYVLMQDRNYLKVNLAIYNYLKGNAKLSYSLVTLVKGNKNISKPRERIYYLKFYKIK